MNAKHQSIQRQDVENTFTYLADLSDVHQLASESFDWLSTLIHQAQKSLNAGHQDTANTLLDIAYYISEDKRNDFLKESQKLNDHLNALGGKHE